MFMSIRTCYQYVASEILNSLIPSHCVCSESEFHFFSHLSRVLPVKMIFHTNFLKTKHSNVIKKLLNMQKEALKQAKNSAPEGRWWIKANGCDVRKGLRESMRGIWSGN